MQDKKISKSPERHTFQKEGYIKRCEENGEQPNSNYLAMYEKVLEQHDTKFDEPKSRENNLEYDLLTTSWILEKVRANNAYAQNLYAAMCNNDFLKQELIPILKDDTWGCSWRYAGGIIADMQQKGDYIDWYCSGIRDVSHDEEENKLWDGRNYVGEGCITDEIREDLKRLGWIEADWKNVND